MYVIRTVEHFHKSLGTVLRLLTNVPGCLAPCPGLLTCLSVQAHPHVRATKDENKGRVMNKVCT